MWTVLTNIRTAKVYCWLKTTFDGRQSLVQDDLLEIGGLLAPPSLAGQLGRDGG